MNLREYPLEEENHGGQVKNVWVDLDDREPLTDEQVAVLQAEQARIHRERARLNEEIRLVTQRLVLSGEEKLRRSREAADGTV